MAATQLSLYKASLRILADRSVSTLSDDVTARYLLDDEYEKTLEYCLEQGLWNFALRAAQLDASTSVEPGFGFSYAFEKPDDYVRLNKLGGNEVMWPPLEDSEYQDEGQYWISNYDPIYVSYISSGATYGGGLANWTRTYELYVEHELATRVAGHLTSFSANEMDALRGQRDRALKDARSKDAMNQGLERPPPGRLVRSRLGGGGSRHSRWNQRL